MEITVSSRHMQITPDVRSYAEGKAEKLPRYFDRIQAIEVKVDHDHKEEFEAELVVEAEHTRPFVARASGPDIYRCIDQASERAERQISEHKDRLRNRKHPAS